MGMFDVIKFEYPLPAELPQDLIYQTKDLDSVFGANSFIIKSDGRMHREDDSDAEIDGKIRILSMREENGKNVFYEAVIFFQDGQLQSIAIPDEDGKIYSSGSNQSIFESGMTFAISIGKWGGFYWHSGVSKRLCLGWLALTFFPHDMDEVLRKGLYLSKQLKAE